MRRTAVNLVLYTAVWWFAVLGAAAGSAWLGAWAALGALLVHVALATARARELAFVLIATLAGWATDSGLTALGLLAFPAWSAWLAPPWIAGLWLAFATTLTTSLRIVQHRLVIAVVLGACAGPLAYYLGVQLGAVRLPQPLPAFMALALAWGVLLPLLAVAARYAASPRLSASPRAVVHGGAA